MFVWIKTVFAVLSGLLDLWRAILASIEARKQAKAAEKSDARSKAAKDVRDAQTEEAFDEASDRLHDNSKRG